MNSTYKYGLKLWSTEYTSLHKAEVLIELGVFDYVELTRIPGTDVSLYMECNIPYTLHAAPDKESTDLGNPDKVDQNLRMIDDYLFWADSLNAEHIILHPGGGNIDNIIAFLSLIKDRRILIENMPQHTDAGDPLIGYTPSQLKQLKSNHLGFCFDFSHAIKTAINNGAASWEIIAEFMNYEPDMFHISDGKYSIQRDEHLPIGEGDYDFALIKRVIEKSKSQNKVTIETDHPVDRIKNTIKDKEKFEWGYQT